jgi:hypothetical protein
MSSSNILHINNNNNNANSSKANESTIQKIHFTNIASSTSLKHVLSPPQKYNHHQQHEPILSTSFQTETPPIIVRVNSIVLSSIYSHLVSHFSDFNGVLIGNTKYLKKENKLSIIIDNISYEYSGNSNIGFYNIGNIDVVGVFSAKKFSFPRISIREQQRFMNYKEVITKQKQDDNNNNNNNTRPFLFGAFVHNKKHETKQMKFETKFWTYNDVTKQFQQIPFEIACLNVIKYINDINPINNTSLVNLANVEVFEEIVNQLKLNIRHDLNKIETSQKEQICELHQQIKKEIMCFRALLNKIQNYT